MRVAMHQLSFLPWMGYFHKIASVDEFVILDLVDYPGGRTISNRNSIKTGNGILEILVPIHTPDIPGRRPNYREVQFSNARWWKKPLASIHHSYSRAPYFGRYIESIEKIIKTDGFFEMNMRFIEFVRSELGITTTMRLQSSFNQEFGSKCDLLAGICNYLGADEYLSGQGARKYNDEAVFKAHGVSLYYQEFKHPTYPQLYGEFVANLSIIDLLLNCGPDSANIFFSSVNRSNNKSSPPDSIEAKSVGNLG